jgi:mono/diheme cytochrome c family protein
MVHLLAAIGGIAVVLGITAALLGYAAMRRGLSARDAPSRIEEWLAVSMRRWATPSGLRDAKSPVAITPQVLGEARAHWADHCAICHANDGSGETQIGKNLYPRAPDMRAERTQRLTDGELYSIIENGIRLTGMPAWGTSSSTDHEETWALVAFIRHLPRLSQEELEEMRRMNPRGPQESDQEREEQEFLNQGERR